MPVPIEQLLLFLPGSILVNIVPGPDMALVMRQVFLGGTGLAQRTILGNMTGIVVHAAALAIGLSALLVASAEAYTAVKFAGAVYLVYLGVQTLRSARQPRPTPRTRPPRQVAANSLDAGGLCPGADQHGPESEAGAAVPDVRARSSSTHLAPSCPRSRSSPACTSASG